MATLTPVDHDPFADALAGGVPVDHDPFAAPAKPKSFSGSVLPFTRDESGVHFDSNAGVLGALKSAFTLPHDVAAGEVDPMSQEGFGRTMGLATTALPLPPPTRARMMSDAIMAKSSRPAQAADVAVPTADALHAESSAGYKSIPGMGVDYSSPAVESLAQGLQRNLEGDGALARVAPNTHATLRDLTNAPPDSVVPAQSLEAARKAFGLVGQDFNHPTDQMAAARAVRAITDFMASPPEGAVLKGDGDALAQTVKSARGNWAAGERSDTINDINRAAELRASASNSGRNLDNATRQRVASLILNPKQVSGFSPDEIGALTNVAQGSFVRNRARDLGNLLGGGLGLGSVITAGAGGAVGAHYGMPELGAAIGPAVGYFSKSLGNKLTSKALNSADELVRSRSPLYEALVNQAPPVVTSPARQAALAKAILATKTTPPNKQGGQ